MTTILPTRRTLAVLMAATLLAVAFAGQDARADSFVPRQDLPVVTIGDVKEAGTDTVVNSLQPGVEDTTDADTELNDRQLYDVDVTVETNGELDSITLVALCLFEDDGGQVPAQDADLSGDCGYADASSNDPTGPTSTDPRSVLSVAYHGGDTDGDGTADTSDQDPIYAFRVDDDASVTHGLESTVGNDVADSTGTPEDKERTVTFTFDLSHAANNSDIWYLRAVAITQPPKIGGEALPSAQWAQAVRGFGSGGGAGEVLYYGGITSTRTSQDFGPLAVDTPETKSSITTGDYLANDTSDITLVGTAFTYDDANTADDPDDSIGLSTDGNTANTAGSAEVSLSCEETTDNSNPALQVTTSIGSLLSNVTPSSDNADPEDATTADTHSCTLEYGGGAKFGSQTYTNTMTVGIYDADDTTFQGTSNDLGASAP